MVKLDGNFYVLIVVGGIMLILGLSIFSIGASSSLTKVGEYMGSSLSKQKQIWIVIVFAFLLGTLVTIAEPSILIVSTQINIPSWLLVGAIALGVGIFVVLGVLRIIFNGKLKFWYIFLYLLTFMLVALIDEGKFLPFIFDAGGVTTGSATVPFILALGVGIAAVRGGRKAGDNSFGLVGVASIGPIMTMTLLVLFYKSGFKPYEPGIVEGAGVIINNPWAEIGKGFIYQDETHLGSLIEVAFALLPILVIFFVYELIFIKLPKAQVKKLLLGFIYTYVGLVLFLTAANAAMTPLGKKTGYDLGVRFKQNNITYILVLIGLGLGMVTILCEPAVHVLTSQIEEMSDRRIKKRTVLIALSIGVGVAIALAVLRTLYGFSILYYLVPGYALSFILMLACPDLFVAIAFDSGGTASGPMAVSFISPFVVGITYAIYGPNADFYGLSFGVVALIALTPIIAIQVLGVWETIKGQRRLAVMRQITKDPTNSEIIHY